MQKITSLMRSAVDKYSMIDAGDRIAVGVSGGKDSVALLCGLAALRRFYPKPFEIHAITADPCFNHENADYSEIAELCARLHIPYTIRRTQLGTVIFETRKESNPCSLCARMRRGILHDMAKELGCNKLALGHHADDAAETFLMNLLFGGNIGCFSPVTYLSRKDLTMIRPMLYIREASVASLAQRYSLPVVKSKCPADGNTQRETVKNLLADLDRQYGRINPKILGALERGNIDRWRP